MLSSNCFSSVDDEIKTALSKKLKHHYELKNILPFGKIKK